MSDVGVRSVRFRPDKFPVYSEALVRIGLKKSSPPPTEEEKKEEEEKKPTVYFRVVGPQSEGKLTVHPDDLSRSVSEPVTIRAELVEFLDEDE